FVELFPGTDALVHVSDLRWERVDKPSDVLKMDEIVKVQVKEIDEKGRVNASIKALLDKPEGYEEIRDYSNNRFFTGGKSNNKKGNSGKNNRKKETKA
ncbi:MAG: S1 RNA-binding domain-containing protein, partial [Erysipelotrichaceae bacterium]|nr:S1 RNA-binding domain-containing protein [Erysipelotrichaceae bacterium]